MESKTPAEFLERDLPQRFKPEKAEGIDVTVQLNIEGAEEGNWIVTIKDKNLSVTKGTNPSPTLTLSMKDQDFVDLVNKKISAEKAFFTGKIQFKGNLALALKLRDIGFL
jgi:putative sterol carrier protein